MSYLQLPRLHFAGRFIPNISTINNIPRNYNPNVQHVIPLFNPDGSGSWTLSNCSVTAVTYLDGSSADNADQDPIVGQPVAGTNRPVSAKLVDLDPQQQSVSEIWGLELRVGAAGGLESVTGHFAVSPFADMWGRAQGGGGGDTTLAAYYQSVLNALRWSPGPSSRFLQELQSSSPDTLSIKFMLDGVRMSDQPEGRIVGTIGPASAAEPERFVAGRLLRARVDPSDPTTPIGTPLYFAPCEVDEERSVLVLDMGNSIPTVTPGGDPVDLGELTLAALPEGADPVPLGTIDYTAAGSYESTAFIQEFPLSADQLEMIAETPLGIVHFNPAENAGFTKLHALAPSKVLLRESTDGSYARADQFVFRMNDGDVATVDFWVRRFGKPVRDQTLDLSVFTMGSPTGAQQGLSAPAQSEPTDADGKATAELTASDPGNPRRFIDGQVYGVDYSWGSPDNPDPWNMLSALVHTESHYSGTPTWDADVEPIFSQYRRLYPFMLRILDLGNYQSVQSNAQILQQVMSLPKESPAYMPVTRDLSRSKLEMIMKWFEAGMPES